MGVLTKHLVRLMQEAERRRMCGDGLITVIRVLGAVHQDVPLQAIETSRWKNGRLHTSLAKCYQ